MLTMKTRAIYDLRVFRILLMSSKVCNNASIESLSHYFSKKKR